MIWWILSGCFVLATSWESCGLPFIQRVYYGKCTCSSPDELCGELRHYNKHRAKPKSLQLRLP